MPISTLSPTFSDLTGKWIGMFKSVERKDIQPVHEMRWPTRHAACVVPDTSLVKVMVSSIDLPLHRPAACAFVASVSPRCWWEWHREEEPAATSSVQDWGGRLLDPGEQEGLETRASIAGHRGRARRTGRRRRSHRQRCAQMTLAGVFREERKV